MFRKIIQFVLPAILFLISGFAYADDTLFSTNLNAKFHAGSCTTCHDFFEKDKNGLTFTNHAKRRDVNRCTKCHKSSVTGFKHRSDWFAQPGLYTSGMDSKTTCEKIMEVLNAKFKSKDLLARDLEHHLLEDPRVLWGIEGATPESGNLPFKKKETDMVEGGLDAWKKEVMEWIKGGMKCD
ncbi:MAG: hypothetical protein GY699_18895 [Desulfobacteraceae bacterium]|nr:hypothetical protein [Desulfobacteraceae bacterium]